MRIRFLVVSLSLIFSLVVWRALAASEPPVRPAPASGGPPEPDAIRCPIVPESEEGMIVGLAFEPHSQTLHASSYHGMIKRFDVTTGKLLSTYRAMEPIEGGCHALAFAPDGRSLAIPHSQIGQAAIVEATTGRVVRQLQAFSQLQPRSLSVLTWSHDGKSIAGGLQSGEALVWDAATGRLLHSFPPQMTPESTTFGPDPRKIPPQKAAVGGLAFAPDNATLYVSAYHLVAWDLATGQQRPTPWPASTRGHRSAASPDGSTIALLDPFAQPFQVLSRLSVIDVATGRVLPFPPQPRGFNDVAFLPSGKTMVTLDDRELRLWDVASGRVLATHRFDEHYQLFHLAVSPDGRHIAAGGSESDDIFGLIALVEVEGTTFKPWHPAP